jgi:endoglucanase
MFKIAEKSNTLEIFFIAAMLIAVLAGGAANAGAAEGDDTATRERVYSDEIKVCQVGYLIGETKLAILTAEPEGQVVVRRSDNHEIVASLAVGAVTFDADTGDSVRLIDLTEVSEPGRYYLDVPGVGSSFDFRVGDDVFGNIFQMSMLFYTGQRCGTEVRLGGDFDQYHHAECHLSDAHFDASTGRTGSKSITGGWHDAGDFGRYSINSGISVGTLLWAYELNSEKLRHVELIIPEKSGPLPHMLTEIRWNLDWMLKMQDESGGVWHKASTAKFPGSILPESDKSPMLIVGSGDDPYLTTQATGNLVAVAAIAARVYRPFDPDFADDCLSAARRGWRWLDSTPDSHFKANPRGIETGAYEDDDATDERLWAAAELFRTTGEASYHQYFLNNHDRVRPMFNPGFPHEWKNVRALALYGYAIENQQQVDLNVQQNIRKEALQAADEIVKRMRSNGYRVPLSTDNYIWGSNALVANYGMMLRLANRISPKPQYADAAQDTLHYLFGRNTFNTSFVTHVGSRWPMNPHHRPSEADSVVEPWPGMLIGGPNAQNASKKRPPACQWDDVKESFTTNEVAINWNAPLVFLLAEALPNHATVAAVDSGMQMEGAYVWKSDCSGEKTFVNSTHPILSGHYEYVVDPAGTQLVFRGRLTDAFKVDDPESVHLHPDIYFDQFHPGSFTVGFDVWVDDLVPEELGPYREKPWLNVLTVFDRTTRSGDERFEPSVMTNLVGKPGAYYLQTYSISPQDGGTFFEKVATTPIFPLGQWVSIKVDVDVKSAIVRTYQNGELVSQGPYKSRPGIAGAHMGLYTNRLVSKATVYNRACEISVRPAVPSQESAKADR